jgi:hypothetical protein
MEHSSVRPAAERRRIMFAWTAAAVFAIVLRAGTAPQATTVQSVASAGTVAGRVTWADGAPLPGMRISALTVRKTEQDRWVAGDIVAASVVSDEAGRFRIQGLSAARYHIVAGPVSLSGNYDDAAAADSPHLVTVTAASKIEDVQFAVVRNPDRLPYSPDTVLTVSGRINAERYGTPGGGVFLLVPNSNGGVTRWHFRRDSITLNRRSNVAGLSRLFWWPGYDILQFEMGPVAEMVANGEIVTVSGKELDMSRSRAINPALAESRFLHPVEVTRGGR